MENNEFYSEVGGIKISELNKLEFEFLACLKFDLMVEENFFENFQRNIYKLFH